MEPFVHREAKLEEGALLAFGEGGRQDRPVAGVSEQCEAAFDGIVTRRLPWQGSDVGDRGVSAPWADAEAVGAELDHVELAHALPILGPRRPACTVIPVGIDQ